MLRLRVRTSPRQRPPPRRRPAHSRAPPCCAQKAWPADEPAADTRECASGECSVSTRTRICRFSGSQRERTASVSSRLRTNERTVALTRTAAERKTMMYALRPIVGSTDARPCVKSMYEMRNIQGDKAPRHRRDDEETTESQTTTTTITTPPPPPRDGTKMPDVTEQVIRLLQRTSPDYNTLATRQEEILKQLAELKAQISTLCKFLKRPGQKTVSSKILSAICGMQAARNYESQVPTQVNLVLNVNPWKPPYSIYALQKLWKDTNIVVKSYTHSTVIGRVPIDFPSSTHPNVNNVVNLTVIFKAVNDLEMITSLLRYPLIGEVNFLRYLSRLLEGHNYERNDLASVSMTDNILDCCCRVRHQTSRDRLDEMLHMLYQQLEQTRWSGRGEPTIADIAAWSTIKQFSSNRRLPRFIQKWYEICDETFMNNVSAH